MNPFGVLSKVLRLAWNILFVGLLAFVATGCASYNTKAKAVTKLYQEGHITTQDYEARLQQLRIADQQQGNAGRMVFIGVAQGVVQGTAQGIQNAQLNNQLTKIQQTQTEQKMQLNAIQTQQGKAGKY